MTRSPSCPTCRSSNPKIAASNCHNSWHHGTDVHLQRESIGTSGAECHAACGATIDDPPGQLVVAMEFVSCPACLATVPACDRVHPAPSCASLTCYREEAARKADGILPGLGGLVRKGRLDPGMPDDDDKIRKGSGSLWRDQATVIRLSGDEIEPASEWRQFDHLKRTAGHAPVEPAPALALATAEKLPEYETVTTRMDVLVSNTGQYDHLLRTNTRACSIAASFQDMLRTAYQAGVASATTGEIFEIWYQREVLP